MNKRLTLISGAIGVFAALALVATGCTGPFQKQAAEKAVERAIEQTSGGNVDISTANNSLTITSDDGEATFGTGTLPQNFPTDIPIYPQATVTFSHVGSGTDADSASATLETSDNPDQVTTWYQSQITAQGWTIQGTDTWGSGAEKYTNYTATKGDRTLSVGISVTEKTIITLTAFKTMSQDL